MLSRTLLQYKITNPLLYIIIHTPTMKDLIGKIMRKREEYSSISPRRRRQYSKICCDEHEIRRGYVPIMVGKCEEEEERFMVPLRLMKHPFIIDLLQLSANEFGYQQDGVIQIPCQPLHFRLVMDNISSKN